MMEIRELVPLLKVDDPERSIDFYTGPLSFRLVEDLRVSGRTAWALLRNGGAKLMISAAEEPARPRGNLAAPVLCLSVESARDVRDALIARGVAAGDIVIEPYGMEVFRVRDPDGYEIAIGSPLVRIA